MELCLYSPGCSPWGTGLETRGPDGVPGRGGPLVYKDLLATYLISYNLTYTVNVLNRCKDL